LNIPLLFEFNTRGKSKFFIAAGGILGIRVGSHTKRLVFEDGDRRKPKEFDDFHLNPIRYNATVRMGFGPINMFANYSFSTLFQDKKGPELYPFEIGISIGS